MSASIRNSLGHIMKRAGLLLSLLFTTNMVMSANGPLDIRLSDKVVINVNPKVVLRTEFPDQLFGFNINYRPFQEQLWDTSKHALNTRVAGYLEAFPGAIYRYPGGLVANAFDWSNAVGDKNRRLKQRTVFKVPAARAIFGLDEYLTMIDQLNGNFWYVLNLVGTNGMKPNEEASENRVARKNLRLAEYINKHDDSPVHYYQLGNELDRHYYEWPIEKYVKRAQKTIKEIQSVDKNARFVAFLRDFIWTYKADKTRGTNPPEVFMKTVMEGLPEVKDYSLHHYYNGKREDGKSRALPFWLKRMQRSIKTYQSLRGEDPNIWITEHARQMSSRQPSKDLTVQYVSNLGGAISTADYLIAIAQVPQIKGAVWHGLNAGPWQLFDSTVHYKDLRPRPVYWGLRTLREMKLPQVLYTKTLSTNHSKYPGGYDVRSVAFSDDNHEQLGVWVINYASSPMPAIVKFKPLASKMVDVNQTFIAGPQGRDPDDLTLKPNQVIQRLSSKSSVNAKGEIELMLPPSSVSSFLITPVTNSKQANVKSK